MAAAMNGIALHGGIIPYAGTFLVFSDYCRPAIRLAALMGIRVIHVMTHDSIGLGEDGPTHQPVEHLAALRAIPNLLVLRPADAVETAECWEIALGETRRPERDRADAPGRADRAAHPLPTKICPAKGAYELAAGRWRRQSDASLPPARKSKSALAARDLLAQEGIGARVVSMPCWELFEEQPAAYRDSVLGPGTVRIAIEAPRRFGWDRYIGAHGGFIGMHGFGASAPIKDLYKHFGITPEAAASGRAPRARDQGLGANHGHSRCNQWLRPDRAAGAAGDSGIRAARTSKSSRVNDLGPIETNAHLLRYDSVHGRFPGEVTVDGES